MIRSMYPFFSALTAVILAQLLKPIPYFFKTKKWNARYIFASGGFPSSHSAMVSALTLSVGIHEKYSSTAFAIALVFALIVIYDAANVRYYSGQNIKITQQFIKDVQNQTDIELCDPIYSIKIKNVLGHKWLEVFGGIILGIVIAVSYYIYF